MTEVENDAPENKKVEADRWSVIEGRLSIFSDTELKKKSKLLFRLSMKERKFGRWMLHAVRGHFPIILHM